MRPPRRRAWLRIFVVRGSLPCDPPVGGHSRNGGRYHVSIAVTKAHRQVQVSDPLRRLLDPEVAVSNGSACTDGFADDVRISHLRPAGFVRTQLELENVADANLLR